MRAVKERKDLFQKDYVPIETQYGSHPARGSELGYGLPKASLGVSR